MLREAVARAPVALLAGVALVQIWLAWSTALTPWCGGGFGMFSTLDSRGARTLRATLLGDGWEEPVEIPPALEDEARRAAALPSDGRLARLARQLAPTEPDDFGGARALRVEVFTTEFSRADLRPSALALRSLEVPVGEP